MKRDHILILTNQEQETGGAGAGGGVAAGEYRGGAGEAGHGGGNRAGSGLGVAPGPRGDDDRAAGGSFDPGPAAFQATLRTAVTAAQETGELVTIGIKPTWACPGFGYIEQGER